MIWLLHFLAGAWVILVAGVVSASADSEPIDCTLKVLFLSYSEPSENDHLYLDGFNFWVSSVNEYRLTRWGIEWPPFRLEGCLTVEPYFDILLEVGVTYTDIDTAFNDGVEFTELVPPHLRSALQKQIFGWRALGIRFVILGVEFQDCPFTRGSLMQAGIHHIAINVKDTWMFRGQAAKNLWGLATSHDHTAKGFVDLTARFSQQGSCIINGDPTTMSVVQLIQKTRQNFGEVMVSELLYKEIHRLRNMSELAAEIVSSGCDILVAYLDSTIEAATLQWELANLRTPLVAQLILPTINQTVWQGLGRIGEQVFSSTEWHHSVDFADELFGSTEVFVHLYRHWRNETFGEDRLPTVPEATATAAGVLIQVALYTLWHGSDSFDGFDNPPDSLIGSLGLDGMEEDDADVFSERIDDTIKGLDISTFFGPMHFDGKGMNVGKNHMTLQYLENADAVVVQPRAGSSQNAVLPMDSFEARDGCPPGTHRDASADTSSSWTTRGIRCTNCTSMTYQDNFNQSGCIPCPPGQVSEEGSTSCQSCPAGQYRSPLQSMCTLCQWGEFSNSSGSTQCARCPAGSFANETGQSECQVCPAGTVAPEPGGKRECHACALGFSTNGKNGQSNCVACSKDSYSEEEGSPTCTPCPKTFGTENIASEKQSMCLCPPGSYWHKAAHDSDPICISKHCGRGLHCEGWTDDPPVTAAGYSAGAPGHPGGEPSYVVLCTNTVDCPGNLPLGVCPRGHEDGRACAQCQDGYGRRRDACEKCNGLAWYVPLLLALGLGCLLAVCIYGLRFADLNVQAETVRQITAVTGIVLTAMQNLSVFRYIKVEWPEPIHSFHVLYDSLMQPMQLLKVGCMLSLSNAFQNYLLLMAVWPGAALLIFVFYKVASCFIWHHQLKGTTIQIIQIEGTLILLFYTSITMFSLVPWQCEENPDGTSSVVAYRQVLCWSGSEHKSMIFISCIAILFFIVGFMSVIAWATYQYPIKITRPSGVKFLRIFRWIFNRFAPDKYYYGLIYCSRNLLVTVLPVIFVDDVPFQFLLVASILQFCLIFQCWKKPWRTDLANKFDATSTVLLILLLIVGSLLLSTNAAELAFLMSLFCGIIFGVFGVGLLVALSHSVYLRLTRHKEFTFFLCHHKVAAAVLARWVKIELQLRRKGHVFLDSDELNRLDKLFEVVGYETQNFVVLLTNETLRRIWCAGEITTALRKKVNVVCIACNDYEEPTDDFIRDLGTMWTDAQLTEVSRQGVSLEQIQAAFLQFRQLPKIRHDRGASFKKQTQLIESLIAHGRGAPMSVVPPPSKQLSDVASEGTAKTPPFSRSSNGASKFFKMPTVSARSDQEQNLLVSDLDDPEVFLVSRVLQLQLQQVLQSGIHVASKCTQDALKELPSLQPSFLIAVLTRGVLAKPGFAIILAHVLSSENPPTLVPVVADDSFAFPDAQFWADLETGTVIAPEALLQHRVALADVLRAYKSLFMVISKRFSSHGSEKIQLTEVREIAELWPMFRSPTQRSW